MAKKQLDETKIREALELLNQAADENGEQLLEMVSDQYESLKRFVTKGERELGAMLDTTKDRIRATAGRVDSHVHANPWAYIGGSAALGLLIGVLIARGRD